MNKIWHDCITRFKQELSPADFAFVNLLNAKFLDEVLYLSAPSDYVLQTIQAKFLNQIREQVFAISGAPIEILLDVQESPSDFLESLKQENPLKPESVKTTAVQNSKQVESFVTGLNASYTFENFVEGKANQLAFAAAKQVAFNAGGSYNPFYIYGATGLGKTHIMQAIGNYLIAEQPQLRVLYITSERFVQDMITALQRNKIDKFKDYYRSLDALLIDDIQFFAGKDRSQEEFFHAFNALLELNKQIILTADQYPKQLENLSERLQSRLGWGLSIQVEPPELEMRVAILLKKAELKRVQLPDEVAFFIAKKIRSNVRELEGALNRVIAHSSFLKKHITIDIAKDALKDLIAVQQRMISVENIQKTVAQYYKIRVADLLSKNRSRNVARPRQVAMALAKELTSHSYPEVGDAFGGRDHTTVLHACKKIVELRQSDVHIDEDYSNLYRILSS